VGWARKESMDAINNVAMPSDIIISMDADTVFGSAYFESVVDLFARFPDRMALANPYYHKLTGDEELDRLMLRYEIYMRVYALNMWFVGLPYAFTALGSAIAVPVWAYRMIGGISPKKSGEDFYFLQKLRKAGRIMTWNAETVYPASRYSDRVFFGTGPALIKAKTGDWKSYPIYHYSLFGEVKETYNLFEKLFTSDIATPMDSFFNTVLNEKDIWTKLRKNARSRETFCNACMQKIDGLRILQFLKWRAAQINISDEDSFIDFLNLFYKGTFALNTETFSFKSYPLVLLNAIRDFLCAEEKKWQFNDLFQ